MKPAPRRRTLRAAIDQAVRGARRLARTVTANVAAAQRESRGAASRRPAARARSRHPAAPFPAVAQPNGGTSIELWRADDGGIAALEGALQGSVFTEFAMSPAVDPQGIKVTVTGRVVKLTGTVPSYPMKLAAGRAARSVRRVEEVVNDLCVTLDETERTSDWELAVAATQALRSNVLVPRGAVTATVTSGCIRLAGAVGYGAERRAAAEAVERLVGLRGLRNDVAVAAGVAPGNLARRVTAALELVPAIRQRRLDVRVSGNIVELRGTVRTLADRDAAVMAAWEVRGVGAVRDMLRIRR